MVSCRVIDSYFNIEQIQIRDIEMMIYVYGLSGMFRSRVRSISIGNHNYIDRRIHLY